MKTKFDFAYTDSGLLPRIRDNYSHYHHFFPSKEQYAIIEPFISGSAMSGGFDLAVKFLATRDDRLHEEASENDGELPFGCCSSYVDPKLLCIYETTSGTILCVDILESFQISLPIVRTGGFHHKIILLVLAGVTSAQLSRYENLHTVDVDEFESAHKERKALYDSILCRHGYNPCESWDQHVQAECNRKASLASRVGEGSINDDTDYEDYEGADLQDDDS